jgi:thioredoxin 2
MDAATVTCATCRTKNQVPFVAVEAPRCTQCQGFLPWITQATDADYTTIADSSTVVVCVELWAAWAQPSRLVGPLLERVVAERAGRMKLVKVNVEDARRVQSKHDARLIPTLLLLWQGEEIGRHTGALQLPQLRRWVDQGIATAFRPAKTPS